MTDGETPDENILPFDPKRKRKPGAKPSPLGGGEDAAGLAAGYWREDGSILTATSAKKPIPILLCSDMRALHAESSPDEWDWILTVEVTGPRGLRKQVCFSRADAETDPAKCMRALVDAGLLVHTDRTNRHRLILNAVVRAKVPLAYGVVKTGLTKVGDRHVFALPTGVIEADGAKTDGSIVVWRGGVQHGRVKQAGTRAGWISGVIEQVKKVPLAVASIGVMLSGPAVPYLPKECESNTMIHYVGDSGGGKTTIVRAGATVHGKGSQTTDPDSFLESYKNTINSSENILLAGNHLGICFDELKTIEQKAAATFAYDFAAGRRKGRMYPDGSPRPTDSWALPGLSSGEITLADRAGEQAFHRRTMDAGAEVRVINIPADHIFDGVADASADRKKFADLLGAAAATDYGFAGPEFIRVLLSHEARVHEAIAKNLLTWGIVSGSLLGVAPSAQASRVASRLGPLVAPAALAAEVLEFPWSGSLTKFGASATPAASAMFMAFADVLDYWIDASGVAYSTQTGAIFQRLRAYYHGAPKGAFVPCAATRHDVIPTDESLALQADTVSRRGWRALENVKTTLDRWGDTKAVVGDLLYVDFIPDVLREGLGETKRALDQALASLRDQGLLITQGGGSLQTQRKVEGRNTTVYRIKGEFFADEPIQDSNISGISL